MKLILGDCLDILKTLPENSLDSCVTDPPYALNFMGKKWDADVPSVELWREVYRVLKPGAHLLAFGGTRTYHRLAVNIEDAGFEIRDQIQWIYGQGFPKSLDISKAIDKMHGAEREIVGKPATPDAQKWEGWGTALKPANEPIVVARKPLSESTVAKNVLKWGTGALNIDGCRIATDEKDLKGMLRTKGTNIKGGNFKNGKGEYTPPEPNAQGRFPANVIFDHEATELLDAQAGQNVSRFFYCAKASKSERNAGLEGLEAKEKKTLNDYKNPSEGRTASKSGAPMQNFHPTVKPVKLMEYLVKLVTPQNGTVLDPFMGSGTTGVACKNLGFNFIGIEKDEEYFKIAKKRIE